MSTSRRAVARPIAPIASGSSSSPASMTATKSPRAAAAAAVRRSAVSPDPANAVMRMSAPSVLEYSAARSPTSVSSQNGSRCRNSEPRVAASRSSELPSTARSRVRRGGPQRRPLRTRYQMLRRYLCRLEPEGASRRWRARSRGRSMTGKIGRRAYHGNTLQFVTLPRSPIPPAARLARLFRHSTTIDPYLDESGPSARRLGAVALDGVSYDALDLSAPGGLRVEFRTAAPSLLHVPCAVAGAPPSAVRFDVAVTPRDGDTVAKHVEIGAIGSGRWHLLTFAVPRGTLTLTIAVTPHEPAARPICGVPSLVWRKSMQAVSRSL